MRSKYGWEEYRRIGEGRGLRLLSSALPPSYEEEVTWQCQCGALVTRSLRSVMRTYAVCRCRGRMNRLKPSDYHALGRSIGATPLIETSPHNIDTPVYWQFNDRSGKILASYRQLYHHLKGPTYRGKK